MPEINSKFHANFQAYFQAYFLAYFLAYLLNRKAALYKTGRLFTAIGLCLLFSACENLITKVEPWERGNLANEVMVREGSAHQNALEGHVYASKEGTMGGFGVGGGGCGCN